MDIFVHLCPSSKTVKAFYFTYVSPCRIFVSVTKNFSSDVQRNYGVSLLKRWLFQLQHSVRIRYSRSTVYGEGPHERWKSVCVWHGWWVTEGPRGLSLLHPFRQPPYLCQLRVEESQTGLIRFDTLLRSDSQKRKKRFVVHFDLQTVSITNFLFN